MGKMEHEMETGGLFGGYLLLAGNEGMETNMENYYDGLYTSPDNQKPGWGISGLANGVFIGFREGRT